MIRWVALLLGIALMLSGSFHSSAQNVGANQGIGVIIGGTSGGGGGGGGCTNKLDFTQACNSQYITSVF
jgi:hypothetical protein